MWPASPQALPVAQRAASICSTCGRVESVQAIEQAAPAAGVGAVAGGVLGAVVGNQIGKGNGRTAATVLGAVGGGYAGHEIEKRTRTQTTYQVRVRLEDGSSRVFTRSQRLPWAPRWCCRARASAWPTRAPCRRRSSPSQRPSTRRFRSPATWPCSSEYAGAGLEPGRCLAQTHEKG